VDIPLREIGSGEGGEPVRITLKSLGVLLALVAHAGRVVSREALLEWVWPDTMPSDDVVTQAITQLRKALGDERDHPRYIETIAKQGYRLVAPIEWLIEDAATAPPTSEASEPAMATTTSSRRRSWLWIGAALGSIALVAVVLATTGVWPRRDRASADDGVATPTPPLAQTPMLRIASAPISEYAPSLSPDGSLVVYSRDNENENGASLLIQPVSAVPPTALTEAIAGRWDESPAWSPDGREIAFTRTDSNDRRCNVMLIPATGGAPREIGSCLNGMRSLEWYPDGRALIGGGRLSDDGAGSEGSVLHRLEIEDGHWRPIAYQRQPHDIDIQPSVSPDGRWIAFQRSLSLGDLWRIPVEGGTPQRLTRLRTNFFGQAWTPDNRAVIFSYLRSGQVRLGKLDLASGAIVDYATDDEMLEWPTIAAAGDAVVFVIQVSRTQLREVALKDGEQAYARSQPVLSSSRSETLPALAPDGRQLLFVSSRDGTERLWWADRTRPDSLRPIPGLMPMPRLPTVWHPDSTRALTIGELPDGAKRVYELEPERGRVTMLDVPDEAPVHAAYHTDPNRILVVAERAEGRLGMTLYDRSVRPWRSLAHVEDVVYALTDPAERRIVFVRTFKPGIWQVDLDLRGLKQIDTVGYQQRVRSLMLGADGVWLADGDSGCEWRLRRVKGTQAPESYCLGAGAYTPVGLGLDTARGRWISATISESGMDIGVLPLSAFARKDATKPSPHIAP